MQFSTIISIIASAALVAAAPQPQTEINNACGNNNAVSCCDTEAPSGLLTAIVGGSCSIQIPIIAVAVGNSCGAAQTFCCPMSTPGELALQGTCVPINVVG